MDLIFQVQTTYNHICELLIICICEIFFIPLQSNLLFIVSVELIIKFVEN